MPAATVLKLLGSVTADAGALFQPAPLLPPSWWFSDEAADNAPERFTIYPDGSVAGIVAPAGRCLLDGSGECWTVPRPLDGRGSTLFGSPDDDYYIANGGATPCADGTVVATGVLAGAGGHDRRGPKRSGDSAGDHYANTAHQQARVRYVWSDTAGNGVGGVVAVGALWPEVSERDVAGILASATSIDYRWIIDEGQYRLIGCCLVNIGGLPSRYASALDTGLALTDQWEPEADVPTEFVASLGLDAAHASSSGGTVGAMNRRRARYCTTCPPVDRTAAFRAVTPAGPAWFAEVTYDGGVGAFVDVMTDTAGAELWVVHPVVESMIDMDQRVVVAASAATLTGRRFEWAEVDEDAVIPAGVPVESDGPSPAYMAAAGDEVPLPGDPMQELTNRVASLESTLGEVLAKVSDVQDHIIGQALAEV